MILHPILSAPFGLSEAADSILPCMREPPQVAPAAPVENDPPLSLLFIGIVLVEAITIASLYWFGRHFS